jgi:predicted DNA-binding transcriptional regulator YafY
MAWLLQAEDRTVDDLARRFGVSRRTVYRDLRLLDEAGLPLVTQHNGKGYRLIVPRSTGPAPGEARAWM